MASRRHWHLSVLSALVGASLLAACGGGDSEPIATRVVVFGDSLSDVGAYTPATQIPLATLGAGTGQQVGEAPYLGGKFTTNTHTGYACQRDTNGALVRGANNALICSNSSNSSTWGEWVAARVGVAVTPHEVGFGPQSRLCPAAATSPALANSCTGYAQGGSRVTSPAGIGNPNGNGINGASPAPMTRSMVAQVAQHLTRFTSFGAGDIVFVYGGNNDVFVQFGAVGQGLPVPTAIANVQQAATELATLVRSQILARGATRVAVMNLPDSSATPQFRTLPAANRALLSQLSADFNTALASGLSGSGAQMIDARGWSASVLASPASFGFSNVTDRACDPARMAVATGGSSLFCNAASASLFTAASLPNLNSLRTDASASTWLFADGVHPTSGGHKAFGDYVITQIKDFGWLPANL